MIKTELIQSFTVKEITTTYHNMIDICPGRWNEYGERRIFFAEDVIEIRKSERMFLMECIEKTAVCCEDNSFARLLIDLIHRRIKQVEMQDNQLKGEEE